MITFFAIKHQKENNQKEKEKKEYEQNVYSDQIEISDKKNNEERKDIEDQNKV
jgi:hypothetical protein